MEENLALRAWNRLIYGLNVLLGEAPSEMLLKQQAESYRRSINATHQTILKSGGRIGSMVDVLAANQAKLRTAKADLDRAIKERKSVAEGSPDAMFKDQEIAMRAKMVSGLTNLVANMGNLINTSRKNQGQAELNFKHLVMQRDLADSEAGMHVDAEAFAKLQEDIANAQLAAAGIVKGANTIKDNRGELKRRVARAQGRADVATRMASDLTGFKGNRVDLDPDEQAVLNDALSRAGLKPASKE